MSTYSSDALTNPAPEGDVTAVQHKDPPVEATTSAALEPPTLTIPLAEDVGGFLVEDKSYWSKTSVAAPSDRGAAAMEGCCILGKGCTSTRQGCTSPRKTVY